MSRSPDDAATRSAERVLDAWSEATLAGNPVVEAVDRDDTDGARWRIRVRGEDKDVYTIHYSLRQRTLFYDTFFMPEPEENHRQVYAYLLRRNRSMRDLRFSIGEENALFLEGSCRVEHVDGDLLDEILGSFYEAVERSFRSSLQIGFPRFFHQ